MRLLRLCLARPEPSDVFQASRLPFDPGSTARCRKSVVLRGGALEPDSRLPDGKAKAKADAYSPMTFPSAAAEIFLSQAGPRFDLERFQAEHHPLFGSCLVAFQQKRRPALVALVWLASAARGLAQGAPSEGYDVAGPANRIAAMQTRQSRHGDGRFGKK